LRDVFAGLAFLHEQMHVAHRDIKPENILIGKFVCFLFLSFSMPIIIFFLLFLCHLIIVFALLPSHPFIHCRRRWARASR
jgi:serine/threonine protein kinase